MIKLIAFVKRNPRLTVEEFHRHWREVHAPIIRDTPALARHVVRYEQNHRLLSDYERGDPEFDGVAIQWYASYEEFLGFIGEREYLELLHPDEQEMLDLPRTVFLLTEAEEVVIQPGA